MMKISLSAFLLLCTYHINLIKVFLSIESSPTVTSKIKYIMVILLLYLVHV